jgi:hypothetical protein
MDHVVHHCAVCGVTIDARRLPARLDGSHVCSVCRDLEGLFAATLKRHPDWPSTSAGAGHPSTVQDEGQLHG